MNRPNSEIEPPRKRRETRFAGIRLVGIFVPWQAVALTLGLVVALTAVAVLRGSNGGTVRVEQASADTTLSDAATSSSTTTTTAPPSTTTTAPTTTTTAVPATTTTTALQPGSAEVVVFSGEQAESFCTEPEPEWGFFGCPYQGMRPEFTFAFDPGRYHRTARFHMEYAVTVAHDMAYCMRVFDLDRAVPVPGSEKCWTTPAVAPPAPYQAGPPSPSFVTEAGPVTFPPGRARYVLQTKMAKSTGPCFDYHDCISQLKRAKVLVEWG